MTFRVIKKLFVRNDKIIQYCIFQEMSLMLTEYIAFQSYTDLKIIYLNIFMGTNFYKVD